MKKIISIIALSLSAISCNDYLTHDVDQQLTFEKTFTRRELSERFLAGVYSYMPDDMTLLENQTGCNDEGYFMWISWGVKYLNHNNGSWNPTSTDYHIWDKMYRGINQATILIQNIDQNMDITEENRKIMKAEARFLRAFYYFMLVRQYGPVFIWGDKMSDLDIIPTSVDRNTLDECVEFITSELNKAQLDLPDRISDTQWYGRATKGAAMALKSRVTLYSARPLFNGAAIYRGMKNKEGNFLFPQSEDLTKWDAAAEAAKELINRNTYALNTTRKSGTPMYKAIQSYSEVMFQPWNEEIILGRWYADANYVERRVSPWGVVATAYGGFSPSLRLVDTYPMASSGRYPVTGYLSNGEPVIDPLSGYREDGFTDNFRNPADTVSTHVFKAHNSTVGRDARFYASILFNGMYWINTFKGSKRILFQKGGNAQSAEADYNKTGYLFRRLVNPANDIESSRWGKFSWPVFRLAEVYLNYAEACNEKSQRDEANALLYVNKIRERAGLNKVEEAYPEIIGNKALLRDIIQKERMIELAFENHRYWDIRLWMIAPEVSNGDRYGRNMDATTYENSWQRTKHYMLPIVFRNEHYLFPIQQSQLNEMKNITQNYGW